MKTKIYNVLNKPYIAALTMLVAPLFGFIDRNFVFFFALGIVFLLLWGSNYDWSKFGIAQKITKRTVLQSLFLTLLVFFAFSMVDSVLELLLGEYDLSSFDDVKGNLEGYIILMIIMWVFAAFGEELIFRGFYMKGIAELLGDSKKTWIISAIITSLYFGVSHAYQGAIGIVSGFLWSLVLSLLFIKNRNNLWLLILVHGFYDTIGITFLYLDMENPITAWFRTLLMNLF